MEAETNPPAKPRLFAQVRDTIRRLHYSDRTEEAYVHWIRRYILFHDRKHPREMGAEEATAFLSYLARDRDVAAATQNQALAALLFLYKEVLALPLPWLDEIERAKRPARLPTVLSVAEVQRLLAQMQGTKRLMASLLYGAGLRLRECLKLRVKDVDFDYRQILVRDGKGAKDRVTMLPGQVIEPLRRHLEHVRTLHERELRKRQRRCRAAGRAGEEVSESAVRMGLEVRVSFPQAVDRSENRRHPAAPCVRDLPGARREGSGPVGADREARQLPHVASLVRDASS